MGRGAPRLVHWLVSPRDELGRGGDVREGVTSFLEKRPPAFPNRVPADLPGPYPWWEDPAF